jgi:hypothetical protein
MASDDDLPPSWRRPAAVLTVIGAAFAILVSLKTLGCASSNPETKSTASSGSTSSASANLSASASASSNPSQHVDVTVNPSANAPTSTSRAGDQNSDHGGISVGTNNGMINGPNAHDNTMTVNSNPPPRRLTAKEKSTLDHADCSRGSVSIAKCTDEGGTGLFQEEVWAYLSRRGCGPTGTAITNCRHFKGIEVYYPPAGTDPKNGLVTIAIGYRTE